MPGHPEPRLRSVAVAAAPAQWETAGFAVLDGSAMVGETELRLVGGEGGIVSAGVEGLAVANPDGLALEPAAEAPGRAAPGTHTIGALRVDHLVAFTPDLDRTVAALEEAGLRLRRLREEPTPAGAPRQAFFRLGEVILEVVQEPGDVVAARGADRPAKLWGVAFAVEDMDHARASMGEKLGDPRPAVQEGRTIATTRREARLGIPVALITEREN